VYGNVCISWSVRRPNTGWTHNFCRNPDKEANSPWCYVSKERREYCAVKNCKLLTKGKENISVKIQIKVEGFYRDFKVAGRSEGFQGEFQIACFAPALLMSLRKHFNYFIILNTSQSIRCISV
jgi:hypothetical protein